MKQIVVTKANLQKEIYNEAKIRNAINQAKVPSQIQDQLLQYLRQFITPGISTEQINRLIIRYLAKTDYPQGKFNLKRAIMNLGPTGFPFERFIAALLHERGFQTHVGVMVEGRCIMHEVDVIATKERQRHILECKFHQMPGTRSDVKVALYSHARFEDIVGAWHRKPGVSNTFDISNWLVTNTKCTTEAIAYATCVGMKIVSWGYPTSGNLQDMIERPGLYPITCLATLAVQDRQRLFEEGVVLAKDITPNVLSTARISNSRHNKIMAEIESLMELSN